MVTTIRRIWQNRKIDGKAFWLAYGSRVVLECITMTTPFLVKYVIDGYKQEGGQKYLTIALIVFAIFSIIDPILTKFSRGWYTYFETKATRVKTLLALESVLKKDTATRVDLGTGKILKKINAGIESEMTLVKGLFRVGSIVLVRLSIVIGAFALKLPFMIFILVGGLSLLSIFLRITSKKVEPLYKTIKDINEAGSGKETTIIMEKQTITLANKEQQEINTLCSLIKPLDTLKRKADFWNSISYEGMFILFRMAEIILYVVMGKLILAQQATYGDIFMYVTLIWQLWWPIESVGEMFAERRKNTARYDSLQELMQTPVTIQDGTIPYVYTDGTITMKNIQFQYASQAPTLSGLSLTFPGGQTTALVGHSGSGKSTIVKLLLRLYDPQQGNIYYDNQDIYTLEKKSLYSHIAYLTQDAAIFDGTIRENLAYAFTHDEYMSDTAIRAALENAAIAEFVRGLPTGLDTQLGEKGVKLSGGEKQRLAIARVFLKNPRIVILDEPTSALDSISEHSIAQSLHTLMQGRTVIIIAHRLQTVMHADNIIVLEKGRIAQQGKHTDLMKKEGVYQTLVNLQSGVIRE